MIRCRECEPLCDPWPSRDSYSGPAILVAPRATLRGDVIRVDYCHEGEGGYHVPVSAWAHYALDGERIESGCEAEPHQAEFDGAARELATGMRQQLAARPWMARLVELDQQRALYVRFGKPPRAGHSHNYATDSDESGLSVYQARLDPARGMIELDSDSVSVGTLVYCLVERRQAYLVTGDEVDRGGDGEPVIAHPRAMASLAWSPDDEAFRVHWTQPAR